MHIMTNNILIRDVLVNKNTGVLTCKNKFIRITVLHFMIDKKYHFFGKLPCDKASERNSGKRSEEG